MFAVYDEEPSDEFMVAIGNFERDIILLNKKNWNRSYCELHYQYKEFVIWIEAYSLDQVAECPRILLSIYDIYSEIINDVNICIWIYLKEDDNKYHVYSLEKTKDLIEIGKGEKYLSKDDFFEKESNVIRIFR